MPKLNIKFLILLPFFLSELLSAQSYDDIDIDEEEIEEDNDDCAFISGQHCDQNGICKYCAMCLQSSCILSKTIPSNNNVLGTNNPVCNTTQFGTTDLYDWYDYCLSSGNDSTGNYCAASTECYQYRKSASSSVTYAWHNLTCNPTTCMLIASNGAPPPTPVSPFGSPSSIDRSKMDNDGSHGDMTQMVDGGFHHVYYHSKSFHNPAAVALTVVCSLVFIVVSVWLIRLGRKKKWWSKFKDSSKEKVVNNSVVKSWKHDNDSPRTGSISCVNSISSVPSSAPPSFSSGPLDMATVRHPHARLSILQQNPFQSPRSSSSSTQMEPLPSYLSPDTTLPKYEQAIVTQIRGFRGDESCSSSSNPMGQPSIGSMWVPVYFSHFRRVSNQLPQNVYGFPGERLSSPMQSFWIHSPPNTMSEASTDADITEER